ncbi:hypothetical protein EG329_000151 [Mollisiaceae sp. DMI_Dod_QoI]|nr:hypothetical protein EG329_000151 [Helotiales sp. DMI_Dod_QoI]
MTALFSGSAAVAASMNVPHTQNTAPVLEFRCLYTQDLRRKQKRWQDGRLKFHTFNKRVMVYDERSNFVGDTHWREDSEFGEGEELELERSGTMVEVGECVGKRDQDLTELVDKRVKEREERAAAKIASPAPSLFRTQGTPTTNHLQPKSLNALVIPTGHYGRALMPGTSPFEERQAQTSAQEKDEPDRPPKRRKYNEVVPSKSGYAQNLMGTALSLTSSRPPSTATIRYEPVRVKPSIPMQSVAIDLTLDGSDDSDQGLTHQKMALKDKRPPKVQRKPRRSPPAKSGYASNLTGAALTLSRPESFDQNCPSKIFASPVVVTNDIAAHEDHSDDEDSFNRIVSPKRLLSKTSTKSKEPLKPQKTRTLLPLNSSSPPVIRKADAIVNKGTNRPGSVIQNSPGATPTPDRPTSALRIRARSGPKMMMLMDRPSSRLAASAESSGLRCRDPTPMQKGGPKPSNDIVLSQATIQLNAFCQKQEERLQARLRGQRRSRIMDLDDLSSSPASNAIDHQTIDQPLSRRNEQAKKVSEALSDRRTRQEVVVENQMNEDISQVAPEEQREVRKEPDLNSDTSSAQTKSESIPVELPQQPSQPQSDTSGNAISGVNQFGMVQSRSADMSDRKDPDFNSSLLHGPNHAPAIPQPVQTVAIGSGPETTRPRSRKSRPLPEHAIGDIQAATEHFRAMIKSSASQQHDVAGIPPLSPDIEHRPEIIRSPSENHESNTRELPLKTFCELQQPPENEVINESQAARTEAPATEATGSAQSIPFVSVVPLLQTIPPSRRLLINPATRGRSVQSLAANTIVAQEPTFNVMAPPLPQLSSRADTINGRNDVARDCGAALKEASDGGPWSREAFDLFDSKLCETIGKLRAARVTTAG